MRALVSLFALLLIGISVYQLSFTWFVNKHESAMQDKAKQSVNRLYPSAATKYAGDKEAQVLYQDTLDELYKTRLRKILDSTKDKKITWWGTTYEKSKENELQLGLDLQGGVNVSLDISLDGLIKNLANNPRDPNLLKAIDLAHQKKLTSDANFIDLFAQSYKELFPNVKLAPLFANSNKNTIKFDASDNAVINYIHDQSSAAMKQTLQVLTKRIDKFGVASPSINLDENKGLITVELAGSNVDAERVRKYLQSSANLQFWEVYNINELSQPIQNADKALENYLNGRAANDTTSKIDSLAAQKNKNPLIPIFYEVFRQVQGATDKTRFPEYVGLIPTKDTGHVNDYLSNPVVLNNFPSNLKFLWGKQETDDDGKALPYLKLFAIKTIPGTDKAKVEGENIRNNARQDFEPVTGDVVVEMSMDKEGEKNWAKMTTDNVGKPIAIVLDDIVYSAPFVNGPITGGNSQITMGHGKATAIAEATDLANILNSGKLSAPAKIVSEDIVGPTLGKETIHGGAMAFVISFLVIFILMLIYFNTAGWVANIALILNLLFTIGVLSALGATLTAPGIAGLVLTIGMAVDTNVIIFERIKEELTKGKAYILAFKDGYLRSLAPVLDAHVTTFLTAAILFYFGLGPVKGFATTQMLGIVLSLFCGILISWLITDFWTNKNRHFQYFTPLSRKIFQKAHFKFIEYRKVAYGISVVVLILGVGAIFHGFKKGVEFEGGRSFVVKFAKPVNSENVRIGLNKIFGGEPLVKTYGGNDQLEITTDYLVSQESPSADTIIKNKLYEGLKPFLPATATQQDFLAPIPNKYIGQYKRVTATISNDLKLGALKAIIFSIIIIFIYIFIRFRDWRYSLGTIIALLHDVFVILAVFSFLWKIVPFPMEVDQHFIAAILTVIGFSMNDTVIVFDRIREYSRQMPNATKGEVINKAINDTLSRTIMTSLIVFITIFILFLVGGEVTKGFAFAMLIGVVTGTYSSIFVAAPILVDFARKKPLGKDAAPVVVTKNKPALAK